MNNLKRLISMLLCMALMFTSVSVFADETVTEEVAATEETVAAEETAEVTEDAATEEVAEIVVEEPIEEVEPIEIDWERIGLLESLGIIDEVDESTAQEFLSAQFSRAEFAVALVKFNNMEDVIGVGEGFNDVVPGSKEEPYINAAVNMGLIAAVTDGYFYPQYPISYQDAAQAFVMSLGYTAMAEINDSWLIQAKRLGLMSGVDTGAAFTRAQAYRMFYNALHADIMDVTGIEGSISNYETREGVDALYKFFNIKHEQGIIMAAGGIELSAGPTVDKEYIKHNGKLYKYGPHSMSEYLGRNAVVYYSEAGEALYVLRDKNEVLQIPQSELNGYNNLTYSYDADEKTAKIANAYVIKNGEEYLGTQDQTNMVPVSGSVTLIDNNRDGVYEIVFIDEYIDYAIKLKMQNPRRIVDFFGNPETVDASLSNVEFYDKDGKTLDFDKLSVNTVASIMKSTSSTRVYISADSVTSTISQTSQRLGKVVWTIDGKDYTMSKSLTDAIAATQIDNPKIGQTYKFYLNIYGEIAYYEEAVAATGDGKFYAFVTAAKLEGISDDEVSMKVFAKEFGGFQSLTVPKRVTLNGSNASPEKVYNSLMRDGIDGRISTDGRIIPQPVKIKVNENNEITYLSQASVRGWYEKIYTDAACTPTSTYALQTNMYSQPVDTTIEPEFTLVMGSHIQQQRTMAYRNIIEFGAWKENYGSTAPWGKFEDFPYSSPNNGNQYFIHYGMADNISAYRVPCDLTTGDIVPEKEDFFASAGVSTNIYYRGNSYVEGDSMEISYVTMYTDAAAAVNVGDTFDLQVVIEATRAYVNEMPITVLKTNESTVYIQDGSGINLDALIRYDYNGNIMYENDRVTPMTYKVVPGDIVNIKVDSLGYAVAIEAVYDSTNRRFLADSDEGLVNLKAKYPDEKYASNPDRYRDTTPYKNCINNRTETYYAKRGTPDYRIQTMNLVKIDGGTIEGITGDPSNLPVVPAKPTDPLTLTPDAPNTNRNHPEYLEAVKAWTDASNARTKVLSMIPNSLVYVDNVRGTITTKTATVADLITHEDSATEFVTVLLSARYMSLGGSNFVYPHK